MTKGLLEAKDFRRDSNDGILLAFASKEIFNVVDVAFKSTLVIGPSQIVRNQVLTIAALAVSDDDTLTVGEAGNLVAVACLANLARISLRNLRRDISRLRV